MKLEVGMYVRTKWGITQYKEYETSMGKLLCMPLMNGTFANIEDILKASHTLLGNDKEPCLIEPGDYVNGGRVVEHAYQPGRLFVECIYIGGKGQTTIENYSWELTSKYVEDEPDAIKSIVTKEQFESMSYKVEK